MTATLKTATSMDGLPRQLDENALAHTINMMPWRTDELGPKLREFAAQLWLQFCSAPAAPAPAQSFDEVWHSIDWAQWRMRSIRDLVQMIHSKTSPAPASSQDEPFGYFRAEPFGWTDCAATDEGAIALYERPAAPAVPQGPVCAALGDIVSMWDQHVPSEYVTPLHMQAKRALAGQQPVSPDMHGWCAYVGGMVAHWVVSEPDAFDRLGPDRFEAAIAGIIERRLWAMPKSAATPAAPSQEPVTPTDDWAECKRISEMPDVDEALRLFAEGETSEDQAVAIIQAVITALRITEVVK